MKLKDEDRSAIVHEARRVGIESVYVFGSVLSDDAEPNDIDVAVRGVPSGTFFRFYAALMRRLSMSVDVVDLDQHNAVTELIAKDAVRIDV